MVCDVESLRCVLNYLHYASYSTGNGYNPNIRVAKTAAVGRKPVLGIQPHVPKLISLCHHCVTSGGLGFYMFVMLPNIQ